MTSWTVDLPPEPPPTVTQVKDCDGNIWHRPTSTLGTWHSEGLDKGHFWPGLIASYGPLTDDTPVDRAQAAAQAARLARLDELVTELHTLAVSLNTNGQGVTHLNQLVNAMQNTLRGDTRTGR